MPVIDFTQPFYLLAAVVLFILCTILAKNNKTNTVPCIMLLTFLTILVGHTIEIANAETEAIKTLAINIIVDEAFTFVSFLSFIWLDKIQVEDRKSKKGKKDKTKLEDKVYKDGKDGLDILWKKI